MSEERKAAPRFDHSGEMRYAPSWSLGVSYKAREVSDPAKGYKVPSSSFMVAGRRVVIAGDSAEVDKRKVAEAVSKGGAREVTFNKTNWKKADVVVVLDDDDYSEQKVQARSNNAVIVPPSKIGKVVELPRRVQIQVKTETSKDDWFKGNPETFRKLEDALLDEQHNIIVVAGPPGTGKTSLVEHFLVKHRDKLELADILGMKEIMKSEFDPGSFVNSYIRGKKIVFLFDEGSKLPCDFNITAVGLISESLKAKIARNKVVVITNNEGIDLRKFKSVPNLVKIAFSKGTQQQLESMLSWASEKEHFSLSKRDVKMICQSSNGDFRNALITARVWANKSQQQMAVNAADSIPSEGHISKDVSLTQAGRVTSTLFGPKGETDLETKMRCVEERPYLNSIIVYDRVHDSSINSRGFQDTKEMAKRRSLQVSSALDSISEGDVFFNNGIMDSYVISSAIAPASIFPTRFSERFIDSSPFPTAGKLKETNPCKSVRKKAEPRDARKALEAMIKEERTVRHRSPHQEDFEKEWFINEMAVLYPRADEALREAILEKTGMTEEQLEDDIEHSTFGDPEIPRRQYKMMRNARKGKFDLGSSESSSPFLSRSSSRLSSGSPSELVSRSNSPLLFGPHDMDMDLVEELPARAGRPFGTPRMPALRGTRPMRPLFSPPVMKSGREEREKKEEKGEKEVERNLDSFLVSRSLSNYRVVGPQPRGRKPNLVEVSEKRRPKEKKKKEVRKQCDQRDLSEFFT